MSFENLPGAVDQSVALAPPAPEDTAFADEQLKETAALGLVLRDVEKSQTFLQTKNRVTEWEDIDDLFAAKVRTKKWPNGKKRSHLSMPVVLEVIETLLPQIHLSFFSDKQPFLLTAKGKTTQAGARAAAKVLKWAIKASGFKEEIRKIEKSCLQYGMGIGKWGGQVCKDRKKEYKKGEDGGVEAHISEELSWKPLFEWVDVRRALADPALRSHDIRNGNFSIFQKFVTADDLDDLRDSYDNVPTREQLKVILATKGEPTEDSLRATKTQGNRELQAEKDGTETSSDPLKQPLELLEYRSGERCIVVLQRKIVLRNDFDADDGGLLSCAFIDVLGSFYGFGIGKLLEGEQKFQVGTANAWIDGLSLTLDPMWHRKKGLTPRTQPIETSPGGVTNDDGELAPLPMQNITDQALIAIQGSEARSRRRVGANFGAEMPTQAMRTAEGVHEFTAGIQVRLQYFVENFSDLVFIPALEALLGACKDNLTPDDINRILSEEDGEAFKGNILEFYNCDVSLEVLTSTKLAARRAMAAMLPMMVQLFSAEPVQDSLALQGKKVDYAELMAQWVDLTGWDMPGVITDMTPADQQRMMMQNAALMKAQAAAQQQAQKHQDDLELEEQKGDMRAANTVVRHMLDSDKQENQPQKPLPNRS